MTNRITAAPLRLSALALALSLAGCSWLGDTFSGEKVDYRSSAQQNKPRSLDVPPDLTQLSRENRYQMQAGVVSAAAAPGATTPVAASAQQTVAPLAVGDMRIEREGNQRWLLVRQAPEQLWPQIKAFWQEAGFTIAQDMPDAGVLETDWAENRAKLPQDAVRSTLGKLLGNVYDTGERDRFRTRIERTAGGSEVYISHRGMQEVYAGERKESTVWQARPSDPELEAEMLSRLMVKLGAKPEAARATVAQAATAPQAPARARAVGSAAALEVDEPFDRAWRRVGLALDRSGFTVEDRDRTAGLYYVRYIDPKFAGKEEPGFFAKLFGSAKDEPRGPQRYRIAVKAQGDKTLVSVLTSAGAAEVGEPGQRIVSQLVNDLR